MNEQKKSVYKQKKSKSGKFYSYRKNIQFILRKNQVERFPSKPAINQLFIHIQYKNKIQLKITFEYYLFFCFFFTFESL